MKYEKQSTVGDYLIGDGIFTVSKEGNRVIIKLYAWSKRRGKEIIRLLDSRSDTEIHIHDRGYIYGENSEDKAEIAQSFANT
ncbi:MAG: hypothetical protein QXM89_02245 [Candidatus Bathyarchaeia archaeon]